MADDVDDLDWELARLGHAIWIEAKEGGLRSIWLRNALKRRLGEEVEEYLLMKGWDAFWDFAVGDAVCEEVRRNIWFAEHVAALFETSLTEPWLRKFLHLSAEVIPFPRRGV